MSAGSWTTPRVVGLSKRAAGRHDARVVIAMVALLGFLAQGVGSAGAKRRPWCSGGVPLCRESSAQSRYDHAMIATDAYLYVIGGRSGEGSAKVLAWNAMEVYDLTGYVVTSRAMANVTGDIVGHAGAGVALWKEDSYVFFGGQAFDSSGATSTFPSDVTYLSLESATWTDYVPSNRSAYPNTHPSCSWPGVAVAGDTLYVYGGANRTSSSSSDKTAHSTLSAFDLVNKAWLDPPAIQVGSEAPPGLIAPAMIAVGTDFLVLYGGVRYTSTSTKVTYTINPGGGGTNGTNSTAGTGSTNSTAGTGGTNSTTAGTGTTNSTGTSSTGTTNSTTTSSSASNSTSTTNSTSAGGSTNSTSGSTNSTSSSGTPASSAPPSSSSSSLPPGPPASSGRRRLQQAPSTGQSNSSAGQPVTYTITTVTEVLEKALWVLDLRGTAPYRWTRIPLSTGAQPSGVHLGGYQSTLSLTSTGDLLIQTIGGLTMKDTQAPATTPGSGSPGTSSGGSTGSGSTTGTVTGNTTQYSYTADTGYQQWYAQYTVQGFRDLLYALPVGSSSTTISTAATATITRNWIHIGSHFYATAYPDQLERYKALNTDSDQTALVLVGAGPVYSFPSTSSAAFVRRTAWAHQSSAGHTLFVGGAQLQDPAGDTWVASSGVVLLNRAQLLFLNMDTPLKPSEFESSSSSTILRTMLLANESLGSDGLVANWLMFFGVWDYTLGTDYPSFSPITMVDMHGFYTELCGPEEPDCRTQHVRGGSAIPESRDNYAPAVLYHTYTGAYPHSGEQYEFRTFFVLLYGGETVTNQKPKKSTISYSTTNTPTSYKQALQQCDTTRLVNDWSKIASCSWPLAQTIVASSSSSGGSSGSSYDGAATGSLASATSGVGSGSGAAGTTAAASRRRAMMETPSVLQRQLLSLKEENQRLQLQLSRVLQGQNAAGATSLSNDFDSPYSFVTRGSSSGSSSSSSSGPDLALPRTPVERELAGSWEAWVDYEPYEPTADALERISSAVAGAEGAAAAGSARSAGRGAGGEASGDDAASGAWLPGRQTEGHVASWQAAGSRGHGRTLLQSAAIAGESTANVSSTTTTASAPPASPPAPSWVFFDKAMLMVWQSNTAPPLQSQTYERPGTRAYANFVYVEDVRNVTGGSSLSPGPRSGASMVAISTLEVLLFGGLTTDASVANSSMGVNATNTLVTSDVHYMRYLTSSTTVTEGDLAVLPCPAGQTCVSASPSHLRKEAPSLPLTTPSAAFTNDLIASHADCCPSGGDLTPLDLVLEVVMPKAAAQQSDSNSADASPTISVQLLSWNYNLVYSTKQDNTEFGRAQATPSRTFSTNLRLPASGQYRVRLTSDRGTGWTTWDDVQDPARCCTLDGSSTSCCPQVRLKCRAGGRYLAGFGVGEATWSELTNPKLQLHDPFVQHSVSHGLGYCTDGLAPSVGPDPARYFPLEQDTHHLLTFEVRPLSSSPLPPARWRHASAFVNVSGMADVFGSGGVLAVFGGSKDPALTNRTLLLNDLWVLCLANHTWLQLSASPSPAARQGHSMVADGSRLFVAGGEYWDTTSKTWTQTSDIWMLDLALAPNNLSWRQLSGTSTSSTSTTLYNSTTQNTAVSNMAIVGNTMQIAQMTEQDLLLVPLPAYQTAGSGSTPGLNNSANGPSNNNSSRVVMSSSALGTSMAKLYDGDSLLLDQVSQVFYPSTSASAVSISQAVFLGGRGRAGRPQPFDRPPGLGGGPGSPNPIGGVSSRRRRLDQTAATTSGSSSSGSSSSSSISSVGSSITGGLPSPASFNLDSYLQRGDMTLVDCGGTGTAFTISAAGTVLSNLVIANCTDTAVVVKAFGNLADIQSLGVTDPSAYLVTIKDSVFMNNRGTYGGALRVEGAAEVALQNVLFFNNSAFKGGAVYISPSGSSGSAGGKVSTLSGCTFAHNSGMLAPSGSDTSSSSSSALPQGGAIMVDTGGLLPSISNCYFLGNGHQANTSGGAVYLENPGMGVVVIQSSFVGNSGREGGALYANDLQVAGLTVSGCVFKSNLAFEAVGGALLSRQAAARLSLLSNSFSANYAQDRGGAVALISSKDIVLSGSVFWGNYANQSAGGGLYAEKESVVTLSDSNFTSNTARFGAGASFYKDTTVTVTSTLFIHNNATMHAGGVECLDCVSLAMSNCTLAHNIARSAAGLSLVFPQSASSVRTTTFLNNTAEAKNTTLVSLICSRQGAGSGGGMCTVTEYPVAVEGCTFDNNTATIGGGLSLQQSCVDLSNTSLPICQGVSLANSTFVGNNAAGGGGAVYAHEASNLQLYCSSLTPLNISAAGAGCPSWANNTADYGPLLATTAVKLNVASNTSITQYESNTAMELTVEVMDYYSNVISSASSEASLSLILTVVGATSNASLSGQTVQSTTKGVAVWGPGDSAADLRLLARPDSYRINILASGTLHSDIVMDANIVVQVRSCVIGEVTNSQGNLCTMCSAGSEFSFQPSNTTCDACPDNADCSFDFEAVGVAGAAVVGALLLPQNGYWHSSPYSVQLHECPNTDACSFLHETTELPDLVRARLVNDSSDEEDEWSRQTILAMYQTLVNSNITALDLDWYLAQQCATGYYGNLCASCIDGYGQVNDNKCGRCPNIWLNNTYYTLVCLVNVVLIGITIRSQLVSRDLANYQHGEDDRENGDDSAAKADDCPTDQENRSGSGQARAIAEAADDPLKPGMAPSARMVAPEAAVLHTSFSGKAPDADKLLTVNDADTHGIDDSQIIFGQPPAQEPEAAKGMDQDRTNNDAEQESEVVPVEERGTDAHSIVIKIMVSYLQVVSIVRQVPLQWPSAISGFLSASKTVFSGVQTMVSIDCSLSDKWVRKSVQRSVVGVAIPFILMVLAVPLWGLIYTYGSVRRRTHIPLKPYLHHRLTITFISIIFIMYPDVTERLLSFFDCPRVDSADSSLAYYSFATAAGRYWAKDYEIQCYTGQHLLLVLLLGVPGLLLFCLGAPLLSWWFLKKRRHMLWDRTFYCNYGFLYGDYEDRYYYWESIIMLRKLGIVTVIVFLSSIGTDIQLIVALGVILVATWLQVNSSPFRNRRMDSLERISLYVTTLGIYFALIFMLPTVSELTKQILSVFLVTANCLVLAYFVWCIIREYVGKVASTLQEYKAYEEALEANPEQRAIRPPRGSPGPPKLGLVDKLLYRLVRRAERTPGFTRTLKSFARLSQRLNQVLPFNEGSAGGSATAAAVGGSAGSGSGSGQARAAGASLDRQQQQQARAVGGMGVRPSKKGGSSGRPPGPSAVGEAVEGHAAATAGIIGRALELAVPPVASDLDLDLDPNGSYGSQGSGLGHRRRAPRPPATDLRWNPRTGARILDPSRGQMASPAAGVMVHDGGSQGGFAWIDGVDAKPGSNHDVC